MNSQLTKSKIGDIDMQKSKSVLAMVLVAFSLLFTGCVSDDELALANSEKTKALAAAADTAKRNSELEKGLTARMTELKNLKANVATLTNKLAVAEETIQRERNAKWRARNEVVGAQKVAKSATLAAHSVGVNKGKKNKKVIKKS